MHHSVFEIIIKVQIKFLLVLPKIHLTKFKNFSTTKGKWMLRLVSSLKPILRLKRKHLKDLFWRGAIKERHKRTVPLLPGLPDIFATYKILIVRRYSSTKFWNRFRSDYYLFMYHVCITRLWARMSLTSGIKECLKGKMCDNFTDLLVITCSCNIAMQCTSWRSFFIGLLVYIVHCTWTEQKIVEEIKLHSEWRFSAVIIFIIHLILLGVCGEG